MPRRPAVKAVSNEYYGMEVCQVKAVTSGSIVAILRPETTPIDRAWGRAYVRRPTGTERTGRTV